MAIENATKPRTSSAKAKLKAEKKTLQKMNSSSPPSVSAEERRKMIAEAAFYRALRRGFVGGDSITDWLEAESEIDRTLAGR